MKGTLLMKKLIIKLESPLKKTTKVSVTFAIKFDYAPPLAVSILPIIIINK